MTIVQTGIVPLRRILRAEEVGLYRDAAGALGAAEAAAAALRRTATEQAAGERVALLAAAECETQQARARILAETSAAAQRTLAALPREIAEAIAEGVAKVIGGVDLAEAVARAAQRALADLVDRHAAVVHVHPSAQGAARARLSAWGDGVRVMGDAGLAPDACVIETAAGTIRAGLAEQVAALRAALTAAVANDG